MKYKVYIHRTETDGRIFYIGCGNKYRPYQVHKNSRSKEWFSIYESEGLIVEIILETENKEEALELESSLIKKYKRICDGGTLVNKALFDSSIGVIRSDEAKQKLSEVNKGKILSDETRQKMSKSKNIPILQYSKDGIFIKEWKSTVDASTILHINGGSICKCCKGKLKSAGGFIWKYK